MADAYYGVRIDSTSFNPHLTRIGNTTLHKTCPIQNKYRGCVVKNGVVQYYLDPSDWSKKANSGITAIPGGIQAPSGGGISAGSGVIAPPYSTGSPKLDGSEGDVCVHTPKYYLSCVTSGTTTDVCMAETKINDTYKEVPAMFVDAYKGTVDKTISNVYKLVSVVNTTVNFRGGADNSTYDSYLSTDPFRTWLGKPRTGLSRATYRTYARNAGKELLSYDQYKNIFVWPFVIEYANLYSQEAYNAKLTAEGYRQGGLGTGVANWKSNNTTYFNDFAAYNEAGPITPCGFGNDIGNGTGIKTIVIPETVIDSSNTVPSKTFYMHRWHGFDNIYGDTYTLLDGYLYKSPNVYIITNKGNYTDSATTAASKADRTITDCPTSGGFIKELILGENAEILPKVVNSSGSPSQYTTDYWLSGTNESALWVGGNVTRSWENGIFCQFSRKNTSYTTAYAAARGVQLA